MVLKIEMRASDSGDLKSFEYDHANRILRNQERLKNPSGKWEIVGNEYRFQDGQIIKVPKVDTTGETDPRASKKTKKRSSNRGSEGETA